MPIDPQRAIRFDLTRGSVHAAGDERTVLLPARVISDLIAAAGAEVGAVAAHQIGGSMGKRVSDQLGGSEGVRSSPLEAVVSGLAAELSVAGFGVFSLERWGRAVVLTVEHAPAIEGGFIAAMLQGALETASGQPVRCALIAADGVLRVLVASQGTLERVRGWLAEGTGWADALARLQDRGVG